MKKYNKKLAAALAALVASTSFSGMTVGAKELSVELDGQKIEFDVKPTIIDDHVMVPLRKIFEEIGALVKWDGETKTVNARKSSKTISMTIDDNVMRIDKGDIDSEGNSIEETVELEAAAQIIDGRTLVPARAVSEAFGLDVEWNETENKVIITSEADDDSWKENEGSINLTDLTYTGDGVEIDGNEIKITKGGDFSVSGVLENGKITVSCDEKVKLRLCGTDITTDEGPCIFVENADKAYITISKETENKLYAKNSEKGAVYSKDNLEIKGSGSLEIISDKGHGIKASDNLTVSDGNILITAKCDGIHVNDTFKLTGGSLKITADFDGIDSESIVIIEAGDLTVQTLGVLKVTEVKQEQHFGPNETADVEFENSSKGINAEWMMSISGGKIDVNAASHAIHCGDEIEINGGEFTLSSEYEKGISAHGNLTVSDGKINITKSTEGLESKNVLTVNGGIINVVASDDALNATGGKSGDTFGPIGGFPGGQGFEISGADFGGKIEPPEGLDVAFKTDENFKPNGEVKKFDRENFKSRGNYDKMHRQDFPGENLPEFPQMPDMPDDAGMPPEGIAGRGFDEKDCLIINGGELTLCAGDDCLDSNGNLVINGGVIRAVKRNGSFTGANAIIDPDGECRISEDAVLIFAAESSEKRGISLTQNTVTICCANEQSGKITVLDEAENVMYEYTPAATYRSVMISTKELEMGKYYKINAGDETFEILISETETSLGEPWQDMHRGWH